MALRKRTLGVLVLVFGVGIVLVAMILGDGREHQRQVPTEGAEATKEGEMGRPAAPVMAFVAPGLRVLLQDKAVWEVLDRDHGVIFDPREATSMDMVRSDVLLSQKPDLLWPVGARPVATAHDEGIRIIREATIFRSPVVIYSWKPIAKALAKFDIAEPLNEEETAWRLKIQPMLKEMISRQATWKDIDLEGSIGKIMLHAADPARTVSGRYFAALVAVVMAEGQSTDAAIERVLPQIRTLYQRIGRLESTDRALIPPYLETGMAARPLVAGLESNLIAYAVAEPERWAEVVEGDTQPVILYPDPIVVADHVALGLSEEGLRAIKALLDPAVATLAWQRHGYRPGRPDERVTAATGPMPALPRKLPQILSLPSAQAMEMILEAIETRNQGKEEN